MKMSPRMSACLDSSGECMRAWLTDWPQSPTLRPTTGHSINTSPSQASAPSVQLWHQGRKCGHVLVSHELNSHQQTGMTWVSIRGYFPSAELHQQNGGWGVCQPRRWSQTVRQKAVSCLVLRRTKTSNPPLILNIWECSGFITNVSEAINKPCVWKQREEKKNMNHLPVLVAAHSVV